MDKNSTWTIRKLLDWSKTYFETNGMDSPLLDAQLLLGNVLDMSKMQLLLNAERPLDADELAAFKKLAIRRAKNREPVAYILGERGFWSLNLKVTPDVLIPRPDTECLVEKAVEYAENWLRGRFPSWCAEQRASGLTYETVDDRKSYYENLEANDALERKTAQWLESCADEPEGLPDRGKIQQFLSESIENKEDKSESETSGNASGRIRIVDVGTGSGAIILAIASELKPEQAALTAVDISPKALEVARRNAESEKMSGRIAFIESDLLEKFEGEADLIVSNPPYVSTLEMSGLAPEVRREPALALEAGAEGLDVYRRLVPQAVRRLSKNGALIVEIGHTQADAVEALFRSAGLIRVRTFKDYGKRPRVVFGLKP